MAYIPGMENISWFSVFGQVVYWVKWILLSFLSIAIMGGFYLLITYNIKAYIFPLYGSGKDGVFSVQKKRRNYIKWSKGRTAWRPLLPPFNKIEIQPFDSEYIYPGKQIYVFDLNGEWIPGRINVQHAEETLRAEINPVPHSVRNWQSLVHKKNALEYATHSWWDDNKTLMVAFMCGVAIMVAGLVMVYMTYKMAGAGSADISALTSAIKGFGNIPGTPPG